MPDRNRRERLPFSSRNDPPLQRALLELLLDAWPEPTSLETLAESERFRKYDRWSMLRSIKSLHIACLIDIDKEGAMVPSPMSQYVHWLLTEVEPDA
jgi:hypothetical protein